MWKSENGRYTTSLNDVMLEFKEITSQNSPHCVGVEKHDTFGIWVEVKLI